MPRASISASFDADLTQLAVAVMDGDRVRDVFTYRLTDAERERVEQDAAEPDEIASLIAEKVAGLIL